LKAEAEQLMLAAEKLKAAAGAECAVAQRQHDIAKRRRGAAASGTASAEPPVGPAAAAAVLASPERMGHNPSPTPEPRPPAGRPVGCEKVRW
jgi:hypothetical protein